MPVIEIHINEAIDIVCIPWKVEVTEDFLYDIYRACSNMLGINLVVPNGEDEDGEPVRF